MHIPVYEVNLGKEDDGVLTRGLDQMCIIVNPNRYSVVEGDEEIEEEGSTRDREVEDMQSMVLGIRIGDGGWGESQEDEGQRREEVQKRESLSDTSEEGDSQDSEETEDNR